MRARFLKRLAGLFAGMLLFTGLALVVTAGPAQAATYIKVCLLSGSVPGGLYIYNNSVLWEGYLSPGYCMTDVRDDGGNARVDVDPGGIGGDVDSWNKRGSGSPGQDWGSCVNNEDGSSNPYSGSGAYTTYKTWSGTNCH